MQVEFADELEAFAALAWPRLIADEANRKILLSLIQRALRSYEADSGDPATAP